MKRFIRLTREIQSRGKCAWRAWRKLSSWSAVEGNFNIFLDFRKFYTRCASFETDVTMGLPLFQKDKISVFEVVHFETLSYRKMFLKVMYKFDLNVFFSIVTKMSEFWNDISSRRHKNNIKNAITNASLFIKREREISKNTVKTLKR